MYCGICLGVSDWYARRTARGLIGRRHIWQILEKNKGITQFLMEILVSGFLDSFRRASRRNFFCSVLKRTNEFKLLQKQKKKKLHISPYSWCTITFAQLPTYFIGLTGITRRGESMFTYIVGYYEPVQWMYWCVVENVALLSCCLGSVTLEMKPNL